MMASRQIPVQAATAGQAQLPMVPGPAARAAEPAGFIVWMLYCVSGVGWLLCQHWLYAIFFVLIAAGGGPCSAGRCHRMSALHFAREEKISAAQALKFSAGKFFSFFTAPLIPLAIWLWARRS